MFLRMVTVRIRSGTADGTNPIAGVSRTSWRGPGTGRAVTLSWRKPHDRYQTAQNAEHPEGGRGPGGPARRRPRDHVRDSLRRVLVAVSARHERDGGDDVRRFVACPDRLHQGLVRGAHGAVLLLEELPLRGAP